MTAISDQPNALIIIACMTLEASPEPPPEQKKCKIMHCEQCKAHMWISKNKRDLLKTCPPQKTKCLCMLCAVKHQAMYESKGIKSENLML